jgi:DNA repair protein RadC
MKTYKTNINEFSLKIKSSDFKKTKITTSKDAFNIISKFYGEDVAIYESFFLLLLNRANNTIGFAKISQGGTVGTVIDTKIICNYVVNSLASSVILAHNHPSGGLTPSGADLKITDKIIKALDIFDCKVLDHLIITPENGFKSFSDCNLI